MGSQNIKFIVNQQVNFSVDQGYFYTFDFTRDNLLQKTDDGNTAFSYPLDTLLSNQIQSSEHDGVYFWSLEDSGTNDNIIKRWRVENYVCKLKQVYNFTETGSHKYQSEAFTIEHYHDTFAATTNSGSTTILLSDYVGSNVLGFTTTSGDGLTLHLGPNSNGEEEDVEVMATVSGGVTISGALNPYGTTYYDFASGDPIHFYTNLWMFNNFDGIDDTTGAVYKIDAYTNELIAKYPSGAYKDISASTFYKVDSFASYGEVDTVAFIKSTNILFLNPAEPGSSSPYYGSMVLENILVDEATVIPVEDLAMDDQNVYRLQRAPDGGSSLTQWTTYSYELSSLDSFVTSISLAAYPAVIAANGVSASTITAIVKDQFLQPVTSRLVYFSDDDSNGYITSSPISTDSNGEATTSYKSGTTAREVKITSVVEQT